MRLTFDEIVDHNQFEDLVATYFRSLAKTERMIQNVEVRPSGIGADGGRDILVDFVINDGLDQFSRRWVVQCKSHAKSISTREIADINIPSLIHSYHAVGYLLVCRTKPTAKLTGFLENLTKECTFKYIYKFLYGDLFLEPLNDHPNVLKTFFPKYSAYIETKKQGSK